MKFFYYGSDWIFAQRFKVVADDFTWQSPTLKFYRDHYRGKVWEYAYLDAESREVRDLLNRIASAKDAIIRFQGRQYYSDLIVTDRMKKDIAAMLAAADAING